MHMVPRMIPIGPIESEGTDESQFGDDTQFFPGIISTDFLIF
jgi:hypothetical protein